MVILDQQHIEQPGAVILPATHAHSVFIQVAQAGSSLARVEDNGVGIAYCIHKAAGEGGDAAEALEEVEGHALAGQQATAIAAHLHQNLPLLHHLTILGRAAESQGRVYQVEDDIGHR